MRIPQNDNFSTRCRISHRPPFRTMEPVFYVCPCCGSVMVMNRPAAIGSAKGSKDGSAAPEPLSAAPLSVRCCGQDLTPLQIHTVESTDESVLSDHRIEYTLFGGFEKNAVNISIGGGIHPMTADHRIEWIYVRGFQGGQLKYLPPGTSSRANLAFADEDAYAYCDRPVCRMGREHCQFQCKRGLEIYAYCNVHGLFRVVL